MDDRELYEHFITLNQKLDEILSILNETTEENNEEETTIKIRKKPDKDDWTRYKTKLDTKKNDKKTIQKNTNKNTRIQKRKKRTKTTKKQNTTNKSNNRNARRTRNHQRKQRATTIHRHDKHDNRRTNRNTRTKHRKSRRNNMKIKTEYWDNLNPDKVYAVIFMYGTFTLINTIWTAITKNYFLTIINLIPLIFFIIVHMSYIKKIGENHEREKQRKQKK